MLSTLTLDYVQHLERGYCVNHPDVIAQTQEQVVDRAVKQLLTALKANGFELDGNILKRADGWLQYDTVSSKWQYSNDAGVTWLDIGSGGGGTPSEVANPFTLGTLLVQDGGGYLQSSSDAGSTWDDLVYANELTNAINNATKAIFIEQYAGYSLSGGFNVLAEAGTYPCPAGVEGEYKTIFALATGSMTITGTFRLGAGNGTSLTITATRADFVKMVYSAGGVMAAGWWILESRGSWAVS